MKFSFFKKKTKPEIIKMIEVTLPPEEKEIVEISSEKFNELKLSLIDVFAEHKEFSMDADLKKLCIESVISKIPSLIKLALPKKEDKILLASSSINTYTYNVPNIIDIENLDVAFQMIFDDLCNFFKSTGFSVETIGKSKNFIYLKVEDCKKFCRYDSLIVLK